MVGANQTLEALESAWRREPQAVFVRLADAYLNSGALERAVVVLRDGLSRWPRNLAARVALARVLTEQLEFEEADEALGEVLEREPAHWGALDLLATLRRRQGDRSGEVAALQTLAAMAPGRRSVMRRLQIARREMEERPAMPVRPPKHTQSYSYPPVGLTRGTSPSGEASAPLRLPADRVRTVPSGKVPQGLSGPSTGASSPRRALSGVPRASRPPPPEDPFFNETMVDLLVAQGRFDEARDLTVRLSKKRPGRRDIEDRLAALRSAAEGPEPAPGSRGLEELMQGVLASVATELDALSGPACPPEGEGDH